MKKKSEAQLFLERVEMLDALIESKEVEQMQWHDLARRITSTLDGERVTSTSSKEKMADAVERCLVIADEIALAIDGFINEKQKIASVLEKLTDPTDYKLLHMRYIQYIELKDIADYFDEDYSWSTTRHGRALASVQRILSKNGDR